MIVFEVTEEQEEFRQALRRFFQQKSPTTEVRRLMATDEGYDPAVWKQMAEQLGLQGLLIPEGFGGSEMPCRSTSIRCTPMPTKMTAGIRNT